MHPYDFVENGELGDQLGQLVDNLLQSVDYLKIVVEISELLHRKVPNIALMLHNN